jgi:small subunit ribosomal protein S6e
MAEFKLVISDPKTGKTTQREIKDQSANAFLNKKIGETVPGESIDLTGYEFMITGGSDKSGFPMRKGIQSKRKKILIGKGSIGFRGKNRGYIEKGIGIVKKKTVCGDRVDAGIAQINLKITKQGAAQLFEEAKAEAAPAEEAKAAAKEEKKEAPAEAKAAE